MTRRIALTFNGSPQILYQGQVQLGTAELLRIIEDLNTGAQHPIRITVFVCGQHLQTMQTQNPELLHRMAQGGHEIANQAFTPSTNFSQLSVDAALDEVQRTHHLIQQIFDHPPRLFRPPGGLISQDVKTAIQAKFPDYQIVGWDRHDENSGDTTQVFLNRFIEHLFDRQVALLHSWRQPTLWAMRKIFTHLLEEGYQCVTCSDLNRYPHNGLRSVAPVSTLPRVALTFDDDPKVETSGDTKVGTAELLRVIEDLNQTAVHPIQVTFFAVGVNIEKTIRTHPDVIERIRAGSHEVQNHSYTHPANFHALSPTQAVDEVRRNHELIVETFGQVPSLFRPPKGYISPANHQAVLEAMPGYQICGWDRHDEKNHYSPSRLRNTIVSHATDQQIVLLHAWKKTTLWAIRGTLNDLQARGYQMVTMNELNLNRQPTLYGLQDPGAIAVA
ncbi:MAG: polysaccharide deacetylase family protein [Cyanobacteria bacterium P01_F01_bin.13]